MNFESPDNKPDWNAWTLYIREQKERIAPMLDEWLESHSEWAAEVSSPTEFYINVDFVLLARARPMRVSYPVQLLYQLVSGVQIRPEEMEEPATLVARMIEGENLRAHRTRRFSVTLKYEVKVLDREAFKRK